MDLIKTKKTLLVIMVLILNFPLTSYGNWFDNGIVYQEAVTKLLKRGDITWGTSPENYYIFKSVQVNANGSKVLFTGNCGFCSPAEVRPFLVNPDGSGLQDLAGMLPPDITNRWSAWRNLIINDDASKIFFRAFIETGYYDDERLFVYNVATSE